MAAVCTPMGLIRFRSECLNVAQQKIDCYDAELYRYLNGNQIKGVQDSGRVVSAEQEAQVPAGV